jgi:hypothetical protein
MSSMAEMRRMFDGRAVIYIREIKLSTEVAEIRGEMSRRQAAVRFWRGFGVRWEFGSGLESCCGGGTANVLA